MAVATISVNFATAAQIFQGTSNIVSVNPAQLKTALTSSTSFYNINIRGATFNDNVTINAGQFTCSDSTKSNTIAGILAISNGTEATVDYSNYALRVSGGVGIQKKLFVQGATTLQTGLTVNGAALTVNNTATITGQTDITSTTASTNTTSGALRVSGGVGISGALHVGGSGNFTGVNSSGLVSITLATGTALNVTSTQASTSRTTGAVTVAGGVGIQGSLNVGGDVTAYASSDKKLKNNITNIPNALTKVSAINGVTFDWNELSDKTGSDVGLIAQEVESVLPQVVTTRDDGIKALRYEKVVPLLVEAIKELQKRVEQLESNSKGV